MKWLLQGKNISIKAIKLEKPRQENKENEIKSTK